MSAITRACRHGPNLAAAPQRKGVGERFNRTFKEQAIYSCVFRNLEDIRITVGGIVERHNDHWRREKLDFLSGLETSQNYALKTAA